MRAMTATGYLRIGELARRSGVSPELLRAWERRYGLLGPTRSPGGFRLYGDDDVRRVARMNELLASGLSAAEAARRALDEPAATTARDGTNLSEQALALTAALIAFDEASANELLDSALASFSVDAVLEDLVTPTLHAIGDGWETGQVNVAQEHFASNVLRGRLLGLGRGWGRGSGPIALLACPAGEQHDLPLLIFGLTLRAAGWRIAFLGADTPLATIEDALEELAPAVVVLSITLRDNVPPSEQLASLARKAPVYLGGEAVDEALAERGDASLLAEDFRVAARQVAPLRT
jgi:DNA-binding transcriptional MerR regulator